MNKLIFLLNERKYFLENENTSVYHRKVQYSLICERWNRVAFFSCWVKTKIKTIDVGDQT